MKMLTQMNKIYKDQKEKVKKSLTSAANSGGDLIVDILDPIISDLAIALRPELGLVDAVYRQGNKAIARQLTQLAAPGGATGEGSDTRIANSTYARTEIPKKIVRRKGRITGFLQETVSDVDTVAVETEALTLAHTQDLIWSLIWGNEEANQYDFGGWDRYMTRNRYVQSSATGAIPSDLDFLQDPIADIQDKGAAKHRRAILMSPQMHKKVNKLQTNVKINREAAGGANNIEIPGGWILESFDNWPIIETSSLRPVTGSSAEEQRHQIGAVATATNTSGGTVPDDQYFFYVAPVTFRGEQLASAEVTETAAGGGTSTITLSWTDVPEAYAYRIYAGDTTGADNCTFVREITAFTYDGEGKITGRINSYQFTTDPLTAGSEVQSHRESQVPLVGTLVDGVLIPPETIMIIDFDANQGMGKFEFTNNDASRQNLISVYQFDRQNTTEDRDEIMTKTHGCLAPGDDATCALIRGLRVK